MNSRSSTPTFPPLLRSLCKLAVLATAVWLCLCVWLLLAQRQMLYFPQRSSWIEAQQLAARHGAAALQTIEGGLLGWQFVTPGVACSSHWLMAHGNAGMALHRAYVATQLRAHLGQGACLSIIEYPGYGAASGTPSRESLLAQAQQSWERLTSHPRVPVFLIGESLGTGVVAELAAKYPERVAGLLLLTPYEELASVAASHFPWLPVRWLLRDNFAPAQALSEYRGPVQLVVAGLDRVIPPVHAQRLAQVLHDGQVHVEADLDHNDLQLRPGWWALLVDLQQRALLWVDRSAASNQSAQH